MPRWYRDVLLMSKCKSTCLKSSYSKSSIINQKPSPSRFWRWYITFRFIHFLDIFLFSISNKFQNVVFRGHFRFPSTGNRASEAVTNLRRSRKPKRLGNLSRWIAYQGIRLATVGCLSAQRFDLVFSHVCRIHRSNSHKSPRNYLQSAHENRTDAAVIGRVGRLKGFHHGK